ncbi:XRE family transcriptional regulator [Weissella viridescens]|uniref:XRE family transcriptional regulator n=1 Tax=Weissella viridescens TaxID=1629 RepID=A0A3P2RAF9_WEIVI|nr:helix-turn-helix transcriptional regulator [Weissella viridescens]RRG17819.1 XRE family transcriptional regulator [Weissella viridescens]
MSTFENIKRVANERGLSLKQTALKAGLSENALYRYNQGVEPKYETVKKVADALGVSVDYLLGHTETPMTEHSAHPEQPVDLDQVLSEEGMAMFDGQPLSNEYKKALLTMLNGLKDNGQ